MPKAPGLPGSRGAGLFLGHVKARYTDPEAFALGTLPGRPLRDTWGCACRHGCPVRRAAGKGARSRSFRRPATGPALAGLAQRGRGPIFAVVLVATGDLPPLLVYVVELATGAALLRQVRRAPTWGQPA